MQIFSADGELISQFGASKRIPLTIDEMPQQLVDALLATEDDRFYLHFGVDPIGLGRAVWGQIIGQNKGGASTITMQVARNFFLTREQTYIRKIREIFLAIHIESLLTKDEILELYMNKIELGHRSFGYGAAAQIYYGKDLSDLTLAQYAVLAGLPKAPSTLNPISSPKRAKERRSVVLQRMLSSGYITQAEYEEANSAPITAKRHGVEISLSAPYVAEMAHQKTVELFGTEQAYTSGYKVYTTVTAKLQRAAQDALVKNVHAYDQRHGYRGAVASIRSDYKRQLTEGLADGEELITPEPVIVEEAVAALANIEDYPLLYPAVITDVQEQSATAILADGYSTQLLWDDIKWARPFINDQRQGPPPKKAADIFALGDIVYLSEKASKVTTDEAIEETDADVASEEELALVDEPAAEETIVKYYRLNQLPEVSSTIVAISPDDGAIKALLGGYNFKQSQFNRATQAKRQVGSNIKPFIYSAAINKGFTLGTLVNDAPINKWDRSSGFVWRPKNSPENYAGPIRVRDALAQSKNVVAVRLLREVGLDNMINYLTRFGFEKSELPRNESLALGSASLTPLQVVTGFASFANGGYLVEPYVVERIEDNEGNIVYQAAPSYACDQDCSAFGEQIPEESEIAENAEQDESTAVDSTELAADSKIDPDQPLMADDEQVFTPLKRATHIISEENAFLMSQAMYSVIWGADWSASPGWQGTGFRGRVLKRHDIAGKTGTTNESKDAWFSGFSRRLAVTSWIGFDDHARKLGSTTLNTNLPKKDPDTGLNQITGSEFGAKSAQPPWIDFMAVALQDLDEEYIEQPADIVSIRIDKASGKLTRKTDRSTRWEYFRAESAPTDYVTVEEVTRDIFNEEDEDSLEEEEIF
ncbi:penicillin-binding protein 1A [Thalassotalea agarivorans]|nr:PBP1A family penicillin-binding protein [Thalassotalea agarivorans]